MKKKDFLNDFLVFLYMKFEPMRNHMSNLTQEQREKYYLRGCIIAIFIWCIGIVGLAYDYHLFGWFS